jgi:hypothetical protein
MVVWVSSKGIAVIKSSVLDSAFSDMGGGSRFGFGFGFGFRVRVRVWVWVWVWVWV